IRDFHVTGVQTCALPIYKERLLTLLNGQEVLFGGKVDGQFFVPTLVDEPHIDSPLMQQEIFGPILPIIGFQSFEQVHQIISRFEKPLALYVFISYKIYTDRV